MSKKNESKKLQLKLVRSINGCIDKQVKTIQALGLSKINSIAVHNDNDAIRGMIFVVKHLIEVTPL
ncbi:MAG: 50S ribosomal protein L30 [Firmicutes bacterium]|nr:50S ribosomal protein L30 [Bacillota bacterium]